MMSNSLAIHTANTSIASSWRSTSMSGLSGLFLKASISNFEFQRCCVMLSKDLAKL